MESYPLGFTVAKGKQTLPASGDLIVYESAVTPTSGESRIKVKPDNGGVVILRPGQWFRNPDKVTGWALESYNGNDQIDAVFVIGFGEFGDANTLNKFTLDATLTNNVTVNNTVAQRVPVNLDLTQRLPVALDPNVPLNIAGQTVQYTNSFSDASIGVANTFTSTVIFTAAANVNGAYVEFAELSSSCTAATQMVTVTLNAKATAPASHTDGDVVMTHVNSSGNTVQLVNVVNQILGARIKVPAGKGLYLIQTPGPVVPAQSLKTVLYTLL